MLGSLLAARSLFLHSSSGNVLLFLAQDYSKANQYSSQQTQQRRNPLGMWGADSAMTDPHSAGRDPNIPYARLATPKAITRADSRSFFFQFTLPIFAKSISFSTVNQERARSARATVFRAVFSQEPILKMARAAQKINRCTDRSSLTRPFSAGAIKNCAKL